MSEKTQSQSKRFEASFKPGKPGEVGKVDGVPPNPERPLPK